MKQISFTNAILLAAVFLLTQACTKDFEEINTNPHGFTTASDGSLFNSLVESLIPGWNEQFYVHNEILYKQTEQAALTREAWGNFTLGTEDIWRRYYARMPEVRELEKRFAAYDEAPDVLNMKAMLKVLVAMKTFYLTDLFGDIPYSEAGYGFHDISRLRPAYDTQRDIYLSLLDDLKWVDENISLAAPGEEPFASFRSFDLLFNGNMVKWRKLANSLRLRHAMRMSSKEPELAGAIVREIVEENKPVYWGYDFITPLLEAAVIVPASVGFKNQGLNWSFREHNNLRMGSTIWQQLSVHDSTDGSGIFDPRAYIFFETNNLNKWKPYPQLADASTPVSGGMPYGEHRDSPVGFHVKGNQNIYSPFNYFLIRDEDYMPIILYSGAETHFLLAEAYWFGIGVPQDRMAAEIEYLNGINASVNWWLQTSASLKLPLSGIPFTERINIPPHLTSVSVQSHFGLWNAGSDEEKLRFIYLQRWLDAFRQPAEAYAFARRTGLTPRNTGEMRHFRLPYPPSEVENNTENWAAAATRQGGDEPANKLWWIPEGR